MGVRYVEAAFLLDCLNNGMHLGRCLTIGRQNLICSKPELASVLSKYGRPAEQRDIDRIFTTFVDLPNNTYSGKLFCEPLFELLGATAVESIDYSDYEKASLIHDFNLPLPNQLVGGFDTVVDFGSLEHIFNLPIALGTMLRAVAPGGSFLAALPCNNLPGHGLYQFSPEFFYSVLVPQNGFVLDRLLVSEESAKDRFRRVPDPRVAGARVTFTNSREVCMYLRARRVSDVPPHLSAYQSDYESLWKNARQNGSTAGTAANTRLRGVVAAMYRRGIPERIRRVRHWMLNQMKRRPSLRDFPEYRPRTVA